MCIGKQPKTLMAYTLHQPLMVIIEQAKRVQSGRLGRALRDGLGATGYQWFLGQLPTWETWLLVDGIPRKATVAQTEALLIYKAAQICQTM